MKILCSIPSYTQDCFTVFFKGFYLFIFRETRREGEREGEEHGSVASCTPANGDLPGNQARALTRNRNSGLLVCRTTLNPVSYTSQGTEIILMLKTIVSPPKKKIFAKI